MTGTHITAHSPAVQVLHVRGQGHDKLEACDDDAARHRSAHKLVAAHGHAANGLAEGHHGRLNKGRAHTHTISWSTVAHSEGGWMDADHSCFVHTNASLLLHGQACACGATLSKVWMHLYAVC